LGLQREAEAALLKLQASLSASGREQADLACRRILIDPRGWRDPAESIPCLPALLDAVWRGKQVRFVYAADLREPAERIADPLGLIAKGSTWYLLASVEGKARTYRVSRIREVTALDASATWPADFNLAAHWERSTAEFREKLPRYYATFLANAGVMRWIRYRGWRLDEEIPERDGIRVKLRFDIEEEAVQFVLSFGGDLEVIDPPELHEKVLARAQAIVSKSRSQLAHEIVCRTRRNCRVYSSRKTVHPTNYGNRD
jgi:predicted DNA-binding transcriptional regulator YafY